MLLQQFYKTLTLPDWFCAMFAHGASGAEGNPSADGSGLGTRNAKAGVGIDLARQARYRLANLLPRSNRMAKLPVLGLLSLGTSLSKMICIVFVLAAAMSTAAPAQTFQSLFSFDGTDGTFPQAALMQATDGNFYGTTQQGGTDTVGTVYRITAQGALTTLHSFGGPEGYRPNASLVQGTDGNLYGTTEAGGTSEFGTVFKITPGGEQTTLHSFSGPDGQIPFGGLVQGANGNFYGTTSGGNNGDGTVFEITPAGTLTVLHSFDGTDGTHPYSTLAQGINGNFYGTTFGDGCNSSCGTVFTITTAGKLTTLYKFCSQTGCTDGSSPVAGVILGGDGNFYGTTEFGGVHSSEGTVFKITPTGNLTTLYRFCTLPGCTDGVIPNAGLVQGTDGNFYGATANGGSGTDCLPGCGTVFKITATGVLTTLHSFSGRTDGDTPDAALMQGTDGTFYGTTRYGGVGSGSIYSVSTGLGAFVAFVGGYGKVGSTAEIFGQGFDNATAVSFNGTAARFVVRSDTYLTATVPSGATTGFVTVTTSGGKLKSNQEFLVIK